MVAMSDRMVRARESSSTTIRLTMRDDLVRRLNVTCAFLFEKAAVEADLLRGLEVALDHYPLFAGRLDGAIGDGRLVCKNQGVAFSSARESATKDDAMRWLRDNELERIITPVDAKRTRKGDAPVLNIRATYLAGDALLLGCSFHHSVGDVNSFMHFMQAWSAAVEGRTINPPLIVADRPEHLSRHFAERGLEGSGSPGVRRLALLEIPKLLAIVATSRRTCRGVSIHFTGEELKLLRPSYGKTLSMNDVVSAHVHDLVRRGESADGERSLALAVNFRSRVGLPANLLGNFASSLKIGWTPGETPQAVASRIRASDYAYTKEHFNYPLTEKTLGALAPSEWRRYVSAGVDPSTRTLLVTNWSNFGIYDVAFGGGRPVFFSPLATQQIPWVSVITEAFHGEGLLYRGYFPRKVADAMRRLDKNLVHPFRSGPSTLPEIARPFAADLL